jgi:transketolase
LELDSPCINTVHFLAVDAVQKTNSGQPGKQLIGHDTFTTAPVETLDAYRDHGEPKTASNKRS